MNAENVEEVFLSTLHRDIREKLDPESMWLSPDTLLQILRIAAGDRRRSIHKCLLSMQYSALRAKNPEAVAQIRHKITAFEDDRLVI